MLRLKCCNHAITLRNASALLGLRNFVYEARIIYVYGIQIKICFTLARTRTRNARAHAYTRVIARCSMKRCIIKQNVTFRKHK